MLLENLSDSWEWLETTCKRVDSLKEKKIFLFSYFLQEDPTIKIYGLLKLLRFCQSLTRLAHDYLNQVSILSKNNILIKSIKSELKNIENKFEKFQNLKLRVPA